MNYGFISDEQKGVDFLNATALDPALARSKNYAWLTGFRLISTNDRDDVKAAIMQNGGVAVQMNSSSTYLNTTYDGSMYHRNFFDYDSDTHTNHEVEIVGWDDAYSRENFNKHRWSPTGTRELPDEYANLALNSSTQLTGKQHSYVWCRFVPKKDGVYRCNSSSAYTLDQSNNMLGYVGGKYVSNDSGSAYDIEMLAGRTYFLGIYLSTTTVTASIERVGDIDLSDIPQGDGAWLAKNSWATSENGVPYDGFVWISYEDVNFVDGQVGVFLASTEQPYDNIYQYDGGTTGNYNLIESGGSIANVFEAKANPDGAEELNAIGLRLNDVNVDYSIQVYLKPTDAQDPTSGTPALGMPVTGTTSYMGYYTIDLPNPVRLPEGTKYAVVATLSHKDATPVKYAVDTTVERTWALQTSAVDAGQSFERDTAAATWDDLATADPDQTDAGKDDPNSCARIKAFTNNVAGKVAKIDISAAAITVASPTYTGKALRPAPKVKLGTTTLAKGTDYSVSYTNNVNAGTNTATITVTGKGAYTGKASRKFTVAKAANPLTAKAAKTSVSAIYKPSATTVLAQNVTVSSARGTVTYANVSSNATAKKFVVNKSNGKVTVPKATKAGTYVVKVKATAAGNTNYKAGSKTASYKVVVAKAANPIAVKAVKRSVSFSNLKKKVVTVSRPLKFTKKAQGTVTYKKASGSAALTVNKSTGKVTVKKGTKKGTYSIKVKVTAAGNTNYKAGSKTVTCKITVK